MITHALRLLDRRALFSPGSAPRGGPASPAESEMTSALDKRYNRRLAVRELHIETI